MDMYRISVDEGVRISCVAHVRAVRPSHERVLKSVAMQEIVKDLMGPYDSEAGIVGQRGGEINKERRIEKCRRNGRYYEKNGDESLLFHFFLRA